MEVKLFFCLRVIESLLQIFLFVVSRERPASRGAEVRCGPPAVRRCKNSRHGTEVPGPLSAAGLHAPRRAPLSDGAGEGRTAGDRVRQGRSKMGGDAEDSYDGRHRAEYSLRPQISGYLAFEKIHK